MLSTQKTAKLSQSVHGIGSPNAEMPIEICAGGHHEVVLAEEP